MRSFRHKVRILAALAAVLAVITAAGLILSPESRNARVSRGSLLAVNPGEIYYLEIQDPGWNAEFRRLGASWVLENNGGFLPVRSERVEGFLESVRSVRTLAEAARSEASWAALGLDETLLPPRTAPAARRIGRGGLPGRTVFPGRFPGLPEEGGESSRIRGSRIGLCPSAGELRVLAGPARPGGAGSPGGRPASPDLRLCQLSGRRGLPFRLLRNPQPLEGLGQRGDPGPGLLGGGQIDTLLDERRGRGLCPGRSGARFGRGAATGPGAFRRNAPQSLDRGKP